MAKSKSMSDEQFESFIRFGADKIRNWIDLELRKRNAFQISVEDVESDVFKKLWLRHRDKEKERLTFDRLPGLIRKIIHDTVVNWIRRKSPVTGIPEVSSTKTTQSPTKKLLRQEVRSIVKGVIETLGGKKKEIATLYFYDQLSYKEIAGLLHSKEATVRQALWRLLPEIREILLSRGFDESFFRSFLR